MLAYSTQGAFASGLPLRPPVDDCTAACLATHTALPHTTQPLPAVNSMARKQKVIKEGEANLAGDYIREGLGAVVSVKVRRPSRQYFAGDSSPASECAAPGR